MDISWLTRVSGKPTSVNANLKEAMRVSIEGQVDRFRDGIYRPDLECEICKEFLNDKGDTHVDHDVKFETLVSGYKTLHGAGPTNFDDEEFTNRAKFKAVDQKYEEAWRDYHEKNAILRLVHKKCNLTRNRK